MVPRGAAVCMLVSVCVGCSSKPAPPPPLVAQTSGTIAITPLSRPVRIVRDTWGVPHIYAESRHDLFVAQGFVQAQDRLFQMDLWKRAAEGRLSQVLGPNFIERDAMTRRFQYRGDPAAEWASYGPDAKEIADAFVSGVNAWVELARARPPEPFVLAGWRPEFWVAADLLSRTDAFLASGDALAEVSRQQMSDVVADAVRRVGTPPFFVALAAPVMAPAGSEPADPAAAGEVRRRPASPSAGTAAPGRLTFDDAVNTFEAPSRRYVVHLHGPGWNVIGATRPWLPGVAVGHNDTIAWAPVPIAADTQDLYANSTATLERTIVREPIVIKGRRSPFVFDIETTAHGIVIASDREHGVSFTLRWSGTDPGAAAELGALAIDRARSWEEFRDALRRWKMPVVRVLYADVDVRAGFQDAGLIPLRRGMEWVGWEGLDSMPHDIGERRQWSAGGSGGATAAPVVFSSVLGVTAAARRRFDIGPVDAPAGNDNPVRLDLNAGAWDQSRAIDAPGESESPSSPHFSDLARHWSSGQWMLLPFSDEAVRTAARDTLVLVPTRPAT